MEGLYLKNQKNKILQSLLYIAVYQLMEGKVGNIPFPFTPRVSFISVSQGQYDPPMGSKLQYFSEKILGEKIHI
jgi:hypothetical protein